MLRHHVLPNSLPTLLVAASVLASSAVLISASLSYLGLGAQPPDPSWGNMLRSAYGVVYEAPLYGLGPGVCVTIVAGAYILIGEGLRRKYRADGFVAAGARAGDVRPSAGALGDGDAGTAPAAAAARAPVANALEIAALSVNYRAGSSHRARPRRRRPHRARRAPHGRRRRVGIGQDARSASP